MKMRTAILLAFALVWCGRGVATPQDPPAAKSLSVECTVLAPDGKPAPHVQVWMCNDSSLVDELPRGVMAAAQTDAAGVFHSELPLRPHWKYVDALLIAKVDGLGAGLIRISMSLPVQDHPKFTLQLHPFEDVKARILKPDGTPAEGLRVFVAGLATPGKFDQYGYPPRLSPEGWSATTDQEGRCVIREAPKGAHVYLNHDSAAYAQFSGMHNIMVTELRAGGDEQTLNLAPPASAHGRVVTPEGKPIPDVAVTLYSRGEGYSDTEFTDAEGRFAFQRMPASSYTLRQHFQPPALDEWIAPEQGNVVLKSGDQDLGDLKTFKVAIVTAQVVDKDTGVELESPLSFRLPPGKQEVHYRSERMPPKGYERDSAAYDVPVQVREGDRLTVYFKLVPLKPEDMVSGTVLGLDGKPLAGALVQVVDLWGRNFSVPSTTDASGKFSAPAAKDAGAHVVAAWNEDQAMSELLPVKRGETVNVILKKEGFSSISGRVTDDQGKPVKGATIQLSRSGVSFFSWPFPNMVRSDEAGSFLFPKVWNNQTYSLSCRAAGYGSAHQGKVQVGEAQHVDSIAFQIAKAEGTLAGVVFNAAGQPVAGAWVNVEGKGQSSRVTAETDPSGRFRLEKIVKGKVTLSAGKKMEGTTLRKEVEVTVGDHNDEVRIELPPLPSGELAGVVVDEGGHPLSDVTIWSSDFEGSADEKGIFHLQGLAPGWKHVDFTARDPDRGKREKRVRVKVGMKDLRIVLPDKEPPAEEYSEKPMNMIGQMAPPIEPMLWINSPPLAAKPSGKVRITDFWNTECGPCVAAMPKIQKFWEEHHGDLELVSLHYFNPEQELHEFIDKRHLTFPIAISQENSTAYRAFDIRYNPVYVVTDTAGRIVSYGSDWNAASKKALELIGK